jgi:hypothetical protein
MKRVIFFYLIFIEFVCYPQWRHYVGTSYVPNSTGAAQIWSGKINSTGDTALCDKGPNMVITGKDFNSDYGLPYKSAATISQLASSYGVVPNPDSIWFDGNHVPRQIPICLFFQDMDYFHQIFTKHQAQRLDANGVETYEPRVTHIVTYSDVQTGANLINENLWFLVPSKLTSNFVDCGVGKTYTTLETAIAACPTNGTVYVHSGNYIPSGNVLQISKGVTLKGIGNCTMTTTTGNYCQQLGAAGSPTIIIEGFRYITGKTYLTGILNFYNLVLRRCYVPQLTSLCNSPTYQSSVTIDQCIFNNTTVMSSGLSSIGNVTISNSYLKNIQWDCTVGATHTTTYTNNKIVKTHSTPTQAITLVNGNLTMKGNYISPNYRIISIQASSLMPSELNVIIDYNQCIANTTNSSGYSFISSVDNNARYHWHVYNNKFYSVSTIVGGEFVSLKNSTFDFQNNIFISKCQPQTAFSNCVFQHENGLNLAGGKFNYNYIEINGVGLSIGIDGTAFSNIYNGSEVIGNTLIGSYRDYPTYLGGQHGFILMNGINNIVKYNYIYGCTFAFVIKNCNQASTTEGFYCNVLHNNYYGFHIAGLAEINVFNNTYVNDQHFTIFNPAPYISYTYYQSQNGVADYLPINNIYRNNISYTTEPTGTMAAFSGASMVGCSWDYGLLYGGNIIFGSISTNYATLALAQAAGYLINSINTNPNITSSTQLWPVTPITSPAIDLGSPYNIGLDTTTFFGDENHYPVIVTKQQGSQWQLGAYIQ